MLRINILANSIACQLNSSVQRGILKTNSKTKLETITVHEVSEGQKLSTIERNEIECSM